MNEPVIKFPVRCPECKNETLTSFPIATVANALIQRNKLRLYSACHGAAWYASTIEMEQIREYLGAPWIEAQKLQMYR